MAEADRFSLRIPGTAAYAATARLFCTAVARLLGCEEEAVEDLALGVSELVALTAEQPGAEPLTLVAFAEGANVVAEVTHPGAAFLVLSRDAAADDLRATLLSALFGSLDVVSTPHGATSVSLRVPRPSPASVQGDGSRSGRV